MYSELITFGDLFTIEGFIKCCKQGLFNDCDGHAKPAKGGKVPKGIEYWIYPSDVLKDKSCIPSDATHIVWYGK